MTVGISATNLGDKVLNGIGRTGTFPTAGTLFVKLHTGDPGSAGTANASAVTTRQQATFAASSGASMALSSMGGTYSMTATETISHISLWDASTAGNFLWSVALTTSRAVISGDTLSVASLTLSFTPVAA